MILQARRSYPGIQTSLSKLVTSLCKLFRTGGVGGQNESPRQLHLVTSASHLLKIGKVFDVRWVFLLILQSKRCSKIRPTLVCMPCANKSGNEKSKYSGLSKTMTSWFVIAEETLIKDVLRILKQPSLFFRLKTFQPEK